MKLDRALHHRLPGIPGERLGASQLGPGSTCRQSSTTPATAPVGRNRTRPDAPEDTGMPSAMSWRSRAVRVVGAGVLAVSLAIGSGTGAAQATDGRAADGRGEVAALYIHHVGRDPDPAELEDLGSLIDRDCRQGVLTASYRIATSAEAGRYLDTPERRVNSLYAGLLDRIPDAESWQAHHRSLLDGRPWNRLVTSVLASPEYQRRLDTICAGRPSSNAIMVPAASNDAWVEQLLDLGAASAFTCTASTVVPDLAKKIRVGGLPIGQLAGEAGRLTARYLNADDSCGQAARYFAAAAHGANLARSGEAVYWRSVTSWGPREWRRLGGCEFHQHIEVGSAPTTSRTFEGSSFHLVCLRG
ncbi:hypothetical protein ACI8AC_10045 [Geodermatophilus sp. SYSU D00758]